jgi:hypothetical protein
MSHRNSIIAAAPAISRNCSGKARNFNGKVQSYQERRKPGACAEGPPAGHFLTRLTICPYPEQAKFDT